MKILSIALAATALALPAQALDGVQVGDVAPEIGGEWLQSEVNSLEACRGRVVLIEFWRTW